MVLSVGLSPAVFEPLGIEQFSASETGRDALAALKLMRFHWLLATLDVPDMQPWVLFEQARRTQARLRCALVDDRLTVDDEQRVRQTGAAVFSPGDPSLCAAIVRSAPQSRSHAARIRDPAETVPAPP
jgi:hypothetical protein